MKKKVTETSLLAYFDEDAQELRNGLRLEIFKLLLMSQPINNHEIAHFTGIQINSVTARVNELRKRPILYEDKRYWVIDAGRRPCTITGRKTIVWEVKEV